MPIPLKILLSELSPIHMSEYYLIVSNKYFCFMTIHNSGKLEFLEESISEGEFSENLQRFIHKIKTKNLYYGQELTVLLAEPLSFSLIRDTKIYDLDDLRKESNTLFGKLTDVKYQNIVLNENSFNVAYGYDKSVVAEITEVLIEEKVFASHYCPLFGFMLSEFLNQIEEPNSLSCSIGKISVCLSLSQNSELLYYEKLGKFSDDEKMLLSEKLDIQFDSISHQSLSKRGVFKKDPGGFALKELTPAQIRHISLGLGSCRLLVSVCLVLTICIAGAALVTQFKKETYDEQYLQYEDVIMSINSLEREIRSVDDELANFDAATNSCKQLSAGMSKFCQRIAKGVVLDEMYSEKTDRDNVFFSIKGKAEKESNVFNYRDYVNSEFNYECVKIQSISKEQNHRDPMDSPKYIFTMTGK